MNFAKSLESDNMCPHGTGLHGNTFSSFHTEYLVVSVRHYTNI